MLDKFKDLITPPSVNLNVSNKIKQLLKTLGREAKILDLGSGKRRLAADTIGMDIELFFRYALTGVEHLFKKFDKLESGVCVGPTSALCGILQEYIPFLINIPIIRGIIYVILRWMSFSV